jgi:hypothetical protein
MMCLGSRERFRSKVRLRSKKSFLEKLSIELLLSVETLVAINYRLTMMIVRTSVAFGVNAKRSITTPRWQVRPASSEEID